ncbi:MAG: alanyl-tRNA editing protein [Arenicellales bacterium]|nr:alanyl-tRNA editing protein [Arenicellales bacterium]
MTEELFRDDSYLKNCEATVVAVQDNAVILDKTVFYPNSGGQPGDIGVLTMASGEKIEIVDTQKSPEGILHITEEGASLPSVGETVQGEIDWDRRHRLMRMHTCMHLLCSVVPMGVTGGSIRDGSARLDFDAPDPLDKTEITQQLNQLIEENHPVETSWITDEELEKEPELVRTMSVQPPRGSGRVRLVNVKQVDLQPCGGTHVRSTSEIGKVLVKKIEKKGKHNRRINVVFAD